MESIASRNFKDERLRAAEAAAIELAQNHTDEVLAAYAARPDTYGGRYICADTMKELMPGFAESPESRSRLNGAVHNAAAVLSSEQYRRQLAIGPKGERDQVVFVTGIPGAGKSTSVSNAALDERVAVVFEGQMSRPGPTIEKIALAQKEGFEVKVMAVHVPPEVALERTNYRFLDPNNGRGASLAVMSEIQGNLPKGLREVQGRFGESVALRVVDNTPGSERKHTGWQSVSVLEKEGTYEDIGKRLRDALDQGYANGKYGADFYRQAAGQAPEIGRVVRPMGGQSDRGFQADDGRPGVPSGDSQPDQVKGAADARSPQERERDAAAAAAFSNQSPEAAVKEHPRLAPAYAALQAIDKKAHVDGLEQNQRDAVALRARVAITASIEAGKYPEVSIRTSEQEQGQSKSSQAADRDLEH